jgi:hypothetical protein
MPRFFFDTRDSDTLARDDVGVLLPSVEAAHVQATAGLADLARDVLANSVRRELAIEVRARIMSPY